VHAAAILQVLPFLGGQRLVDVEVDAPGPAVVVVDGHPHVAAEHVVAERRDQREPREDELRDAPVERIGLAVAAAEQREPALVPLDLEDDVAVGLDVVVGLGALVERVVVDLELVHEAHVRGVDAAFHGLQVVAFLQPLGHEHVALGQVGPFDAGWLGLLVLRAHVGPDDAGALDARVAGDGHALAHLRLVGRLRHVDALAVDVELQAVVAAAHAVVFVAAVVERHAAVRAELADEAGAAFAVAEGEQLLAHDLHPHLRAVGLGDLARLQDGHPVAPQQVAGGGARPRAHQRLHHVLHRALLLASGIGIEVAC
jgi:hypothetical protein